MLNPLGEMTFEDWICDFVFHDGTKRRIAVTHHTPEEKAIKLAMDMLTEEQSAGISEMNLVRRNKLQPSGLRFPLRA